MPSAEGGDGPLPALVKSKWIMAKTKTSMEASTNSAVTEELEGHNADHACQAHEDGDDHRGGVSILLELMGK